MRTLHACIQIGGSFGERLATEMSTSKKSPLSYYNAFSGKKFQKITSFSQKNQLRRLAQFTVGKSVHFHGLRPGSIENRRKGLAKSAGLLYNDGVVQNTYRTIQRGRGHFAIFL
jgi:hypothetical protein